MILEACVGNLKEATNAQQLGAHQIELCDRLDLDGTSPSLSTIGEVCEHLDIPIKIIVNPNPYNYVYTPTDIEKILLYINQVNKYSVEGIVFGALTSDGHPDLSAIEQIYNNTSLPITFHKAIDTSKNLQQSTKMLLDQGLIKFILTSGGKKTAEEGIDELLKLKNIVEKSSISLIAAGSITSHNLPLLHSKLNLSHYHGKKVVGNLN
ncbi:MAG: copper homeostasis protein CutC [Saprospiraceae bacterium]|nr:copper homeostasis protein CutC [Saprospiraceae bacterium]